MTIYAYFCWFCSIDKQYTITIFMRGNIFNWKEVVYPQRALLPADDVNSRDMLFSSKEFRQREGNLLSVYSFRCSHHLTANCFIVPILQNRRAHLNIFYILGHRQHFCSAQCNYISGMKQELITELDQIYKDCQQVTGYSDWQLSTLPAIV